MVQSAIVKAFGKLCYGIRRLAGSISTWNVRLNESVIRDIELTITDFVHCCRALWSLLNDESDFGKITLRRIEQMVREFMRDARLPSCEQMMLKGESVDVPALWRSMKDLLAGMIVEGCEMSALDRLRKLVRTQGENDISLVYCAQMIFQTSEVLVFKRECVTILMGELFLIFRDKIIKVNDMDQLLFQDVISYFRKKVKKDSYRQLTRLRSSGGEKLVGQGRVSRD